MIVKLIVMIMMIALTSCAALDEIYQISNFKVTNLEHSTDPAIGALYKITGTNFKGQEEIAYLGNAKKTIQNQEETLIGVCFTLIGSKNKTDPNAIFRVSNIYPVLCPVKKSNLQ
jgi:hypothetical protein